MKKTTLFMVVVLLAASFNSFATIITVNNSTPSPGQHNNIASAVAAAVAGDTLMPAGTDISYGNITLDKALTILGPGWVVSGGGISKVAVFGNITVTTSNTRIIGVRAINVISGGASATNLSGIVVQRSIIDTSIDLVDDDWTGALIEGNVFSAWNVWDITSNSSSYDLISSTVRNNIFNGRIYSAEQTNIEHNIFLGYSGHTDVLSGNVVNGNFTSNITIMRYNASVPASNNVTGNLAYNGGNNFPGTGNINGADPMFVNYALNTLHAWSYDYHLQALSPAVGTGAAGEDIGVYDGDGIYRPDGEPAIPIVRAVNVPGGAVVPANATFNVNIISVAHE